jgi:nitrate reductase NapD
MNICSCVVYAKPGQGPAVASGLAELPGVEVHGGVAEGKLVVTLEDTGESLAADTLGALNQVPGVINTVLIYHYGGDDIPNQIPSEEHPHEHQPA